MKPAELNPTTPWGVALQAIARRHHIKPSGKKVHDKSARRIAILVYNSFLEYYAMPGPDFQKNLNYAGLVQRNVYERAKELHLICNETEDEERIQGMGRKGHGYDPLKIHPDAGERNPALMEYIFDNLLNQSETEEKSNGERNSAGNWKGNRKGNFRESFKRQLSLSRTTKQ